MDTIITAGRSPEEKDPLYERTQGGNKALMLLAGRPMISWVVDAVANIREPGHILIYGLPEDCQLDLPPNAQCFPAQGGIIPNVEAGLKKLRELGSTSEYVIGTTGDIPLITPEIVDAHIQDCFAAGQGYDLYLTVVPMELVDERFPGAHRSFLKTPEGVFCGADLHLLRRDAPVLQRDLWHQLMIARKNLFKQALLVGIEPLIKVMLHRLTLADGERIFQKRFGLRGRGVKARFPELGMDVDKPFQADIAEKVLLERARSGA